MKMGYSNFFCVGLAVLSATQVYAWDVNIDGAPDIGAMAFLSGGYRNDRIQSHIHFFNSDSLAIDDEQKVKNINIWEVGGKGRAWYGNWLARGEVFWGWGSSGHWNDHFEIASIPINSRGNLHNTRTFDGTIGAGYIFSFEDCYCNRWGIGPVAGWSYDRQRYSIRNLETTESESDSSVDKNSFRQTWEGPWLGVDLCYQSPYILAHLGYEYHWSRWEFRETFEGESLEFKSNKPFGNLVYLDLRYLFNCDPCSGGGWSVGLGLKYQEYRNHKSHTDLSDIVGFEAEVRKATWRSGEVTLDLGYKF